MALFVGGGGNAYKISPTNKAMVFKTYIQGIQNDVMSSFQTRENVFLKTFSPTITKA